MITLTFKSDRILDRFSNKIAQLSDGEVNTVFARALNHEGDKGRTEVKRSLVKVTGIQYGKINKNMKIIRANKNSLQYKLEQRGEETNISDFGAKQGAKGVSAKPWNQRRVFPGTFMIKKYGGKTFTRTSKERFPIEGVYGPNLAREIVKGEPEMTWNRVPTSLADRVGHEINRFFKD
jgi:hypothetical protein